MVECQLANCCTKILYNATIARAVVSHWQVIINSLWNTDCTECIAIVCCILCNLVCCVLRVITTDVEEETNVVLLKYFEKFCKILF